MSSKEYRNRGASNPQFSKERLKSVELFAGAGGMALGVSRAGFSHQAVLEVNKQACDTIRINSSSRIGSFRAWPVHETDISAFDYSLVPGGIDLLAGGPPCQPFSLAGKHRGMKDERNMFPEVFRAVRELKPKAVLIENVRGLGRKSFSEYFDYIVCQLENPEIERRKSEAWDEHYARIRRNLKTRQGTRLEYVVDRRIVNAADYGIPQCRERVFIVALRKDLNLEWSFPNPTHSLESLLWDQWVTGTYWDRHGISPRNRPLSSAKYLGKIEALFEHKPRESASPWMTVRDAICDLPAPTHNGRAVFSNHIHNPGARSYTGHTGSQMDLPAKTLKAGSHGVPGGENMLVHSNGRVRYFTVRECARLQTFPDSYIFPEVWCTAMKQLGNAVPVHLAEIMAKSLAVSIQSKQMSDIKTSARPREGIFDEC